MINIFTDGGAQPNPGHAGYGVWFANERRGRGVYLGPTTTNNVAEYRGVLAALCDIEAMHTDNEDLREFAVSTDSQLVVRQLDGAYAVRNATLHALHQSVTKQLEVLRNRGLDVHVQHVRRRFNAAADALAGAAIRARGNVSDSCIPQTARIYDLSTRTTIKKRPLSNPSATEPFPRRPRRTL